MSAESYSKGANSFADIAYFSVRLTERIYSGLHRVPSNREG
jgi:hypothetical protein